MRIRARLGLTSFGLFAALAGGCAAESVDTTPGDEARGPIGKADASGTCELPDGDDNCGTKGVGNCWCDDLCVDFGDCCHDAFAVCGVDDAGDDTDDGMADDGSDDGGECSPVLCEIACAYGFEVGEDGCEICACHDPTGDFCGGIAAIQCPEGFECVGEFNFPDAGGTCQPEQPPPPPPAAGGSCWDECGGPGSDGSCWCDDLCEGFGDCCDDYVEACVEPPPPPSCDDCGLGQVCVTHFTQLGPEFSCAPIADECDGTPTCGCMGEQVCTGVFDACSETEDGLGCACPVC